MIACFISNCRDLNIIIFLSEPRIETQIGSQIDMKIEIEIEILISVGEVAAEKEMYTLTYDYNLDICDCSFDCRRNDDPRGKVGLVLEVREDITGQSRGLGHHQNLLTKRSRQRRPKPMQQIANLSPLHLLLPLALAAN